MSKIWQDPFGMNLIKSSQIKKCPSSAPASTSNVKPKEHYYCHTMPCPQIPVMQQVIICTQIVSPPMCYQAHQAPHATKCHCSHIKSDKTKTKKKPAVDEKKKENKERADKDNVIPTFLNPRRPHFMFYHLYSARKHSSHYSINVGAL
ncbi:hypothetical protein [Parasitella parasitica]|uniref:Uncharacterized protein n=1 Tax=Parasitella parasitica TaxID=35722 RepID=A0A0B7N7E6_9FUNG|nr:hypothetical protein [Parasitella parasitica]